MKRRRRKRGRRRRGRKGYGIEVEGKIEDLEGTTSTSIALL
jgi:hypothetical protein